MYIFDYRITEEESILSNADMLLQECRLFIEAVDISSSKMYGESTMTTIVKYLKKIWEWVMKVWKMISPLVDKLFGTHFSSNSSNGGGGNIAPGAGPSHSNNLVADPKYCVNANGQETKIGNIINFTINMVAGTQTEMSSISPVVTKVRDLISTHGTDAYAIANALTSSLKEVLTKAGVSIEEQIYKMGANSTFDALEGIIPTREKHGYNLNDAYNEYSKFFLDFISLLISMQINPSSFRENDIGALQSMIDKGHHSLVMTQAAIPSLRDYKTVTNMFNKMVVKDHVTVPIFKAQKTLNASIEAFSKFQSLINNYINAIHTEDKDLVIRCRENINECIRRDLAADTNVSISDFSKNEDSMGKYLDYVISKIFTDAYEIEPRILQKALLDNVVYKGSGQRAEKGSKAVNITGIRPYSMFERMYTDIWNSQAGRKSSFKSEILAGEPKFKNITEEDKNNYKDLMNMVNLYRCLFTIFFEVHKNIFKCACIEYISQYYILNMEIATEVMGLLGKR